MDRLQDPEAPEMICSICKGVLGRERVKLDFWVGDELVIIEDIPADVCNQCGEKYVSADVSRELDQLLKQRTETDKRIEVAVLSFSQSATSTS